MVVDPPLVPAVGNLAELLVAELPLISCRIVRLLGLPSDLVQVTDRAIVPVSAIVQVLPEIDPVIAPALVIDPALLAIAQV